MSRTKPIPKLGDIPIVDTPAQALRQVRTLFRQKTLRKTDLLDLATYADTGSINQLPPPIQTLFQSKIFSLADDGTILRDGKSTGIRIDDVDAYLYGDSYNGRPPRINDFYRKMGLNEEFMKSTPEFVQASKNAELRFYQWKGYLDSLKDGTAIAAAKNYQAQYGNDLDGLNRFFKENPNEAFAYLDELYQRDANFRKRVDASPDQKTMMRKISDALKGNKSLLYTFLALAAIGALVGVLYDYVETFRKRENGCRMYHNTDGWQDKVELLTCKDEYITSTSDEAPLRRTCSTQVYPPPTGTVLQACAAGTFNPCLANSTNRTGPTGPLVPNACNAYLYRKTKGPNDSVEGVRVADACALTKEDGTCSKEYCTMEAFSEEFRKQNPNISLQCRHLTWSQAFVRLAMDWGKDIFCEVVPMACDQNRGGGRVLPSWFWYVVLGVIIALLAITMLWKLFTRKRSKFSSVQ